MLDYMSNSKAMFKILLEWVQQENYLKDTFLCALVAWVKTLNLAGINLRVARVEKGELPLAPTKN